MDTITPAGEAMANVLASFAQIERRLIGQRTREALAAKRAQGVQLGGSAAEQEHLYPVRVTPEGPICFGCWTLEERNRLLPPG